MDSSVRSYASYGGGWCFAACLRLFSPSCPDHTWPRAQRPLPSVVVQLEPHAVVNLVVSQGDMVLVDVVPLLNAYLLWPCPCLSCDQLLQVSDGVVLAVTTRERSKYAGVSKLIS